MPRVDFCRLEPTVALSCKERKATGEDMEGNGRLFAA